MLNGKKHKSKRGWSRWPAGRKESRHILIRKPGPQIALPGTRNHPPNSSRLLTKMTVSENKTSKSTFHQHIPTLPTAIPLSRQPASHIPLLPRSLPLLQQPLLPGTTLPPIRVRPMPCQMYEPATSHSHLPDHIEPDTWPLPISRPHVSPRSSRPA